VDDDVRWDVIHKANTSKKSPIRIKSLAIKASSGDYILVSNKPKWYKDDETLGSITKKKIYI
jgi:hypothetical protein